MHMHVYLRSVFSTVKQSLSILTEGLCSDPDIMLACLSYVCTRHSKADVFTGVTYSLIFSSALNTRDVNRHY